MGACLIGGGSRQPQAQLTQQMWIRRLPEGLTICEGGVGLAQLCENLCNTFQERY